MKKSIGNLWLTGALALAGVMGIGQALAPTRCYAQEEPPKTEPAKDDAEEMAATEDAEKTTDEETSRAHFRGRRDNALISVGGGNVVLKTNETADAVVAIGASAKVSGKVRDAVVAVGGDVTLTGAHVGEAVVAVLGNIKVGPGTMVNGDAVSIGGTVDVDDTAMVKGHIQQVDFKSLGLPELTWVKSWFVNCALKLRPLAPNVGFVWVIAAFYFLFYLLIAVALPRPVQVCVAELTNRPATTFFMGLFTKIMIPVVLIILIATGIGIIVVPFLVAAVFFGALIGKVAFLEYLGGAVARAFGGNFLNRPALALLVGSAVVCVIYMVPILGLIMLGITALWGLGAAVTAGFGSLKREKPERPNGTPTQPAAPAAAPEQAAEATLNVVAPTMEATAAAPTENPGPTAGNPAPLAGIATRTGVADAFAYPRASFWERMGAGFLDVILVTLVSAWGGPGLIFPVGVAYFAAMWTWRGTTVGGIVLNLKVVRLDGQPVTFAVALVRALGGLFSIFVCFLGFFWIAWDKDRQGWHDRMAGTVVVRLARAASLV